ncbi:putative divalent metal transporter [Toxoplasma gondii VAND]|uniref:Putative divalent metal transporter n=1 Tax=Toxoplasma gondii VAND TaxID=933077 RepID=A0A086PN32_TOXGO|nr:putative divalent metal transporter [Toxoplasma gondii VAND]
MNFFARRRDSSDFGKQRPCSLVSSPEHLAKPLLSEFHENKLGSLSAFGSEAPVPCSSPTVACPSRAASRVPAPETHTLETPAADLAVPSTFRSWSAHSLAQFWKKKATGARSRGFAFFPSSLVRIVSTCAMRSEKSEGQEKHPSDLAPDSEGFLGQVAGMRLEGQEGLGQSHEEATEGGTLGSLSKASLTRQNAEARCRHVTGSPWKRQNIHAGTTQAAERQTREHEGDRGREDEQGLDIEEVDEEESEGEIEGEMEGGIQDATNSGIASDFFNEFVDVPEDEDEDEDRERRVSVSPRSRLARHHQLDSFPTFKFSETQMARETSQGRGQSLSEHGDEAAWATREQQWSGLPQAYAGPTPGVGREKENKALCHFPNSRLEAPMSASTQCYSPALSLALPWLGRPARAAPLESDSSFLEIPDAPCSVHLNGRETEAARSIAGPLCHAGEGRDTHAENLRRLLTVAPEERVSSLVESDVEDQQASRDVGHRASVSSDHDSFAARLLVPSPSPSLPLSPGSPSLSSNSALGSLLLSCAQSSCNSSLCSDDDAAPETSAASRPLWCSFFFAPFSLPGLSSPCFLLSSRYVSRCLLGFSTFSVSSRQTHARRSSPASSATPAPRLARLRLCLLAVCVALPLAVLLLFLNLLLLLAQLLMRGLHLLLPPPLPPRFQWKKFVAFLGPGWLVAMAYLDPGNLEGDLQAGSRREDPGVLPPGAPDPKGHALLWVLLWGHAGGWIFQVLAARLGNATGLDLATLCRRQYSRGVAWLLWVLTEIAILGADIQAVIGCAVAFNLLVGLPVWIGVLVTLVDSFTFLSLNAERTQQLERVFSFFIGIMAVAFGYTLVLSKPSFRLILHGLVAPTLPHTRADAFDLLALVGCIIMPHNIFLHSALVLTRRVKRNSPDKVAEANYYFSLEAALALAVSFLLNGCVLCAFANPRVKTPEGEDLTLSTAPEALQSAFGHGALYIWAAGLLAAGQNAAMAGTYAGQFVMQGFLDLHFSRPVRLVLTRLVTILPVAVLADLDQAVVDSICRVVNIAQAFLLPFALVPLLLFSTSRRVMGRFALDGWRWGAVLALAVLVTSGNFAVAFYQLAALQLSPQLCFGGLTLLLLYAAVLIVIARQKIRGVFCVYLLVARRRRREQARWIGAAEGVEDSGRAQTETFQGKALTPEQERESTVIADASVVPVSSGTDEQADECTVGEERDKTTRTVGECRGRESSPTGYGATRFFEPES